MTEKWELCIVTEYYSNPGGPDNEFKFITPDPDESWSGDHHAVLLDRFWLIKSRKEKKAILESKGRSAVFFEEAISHLLSEGWEPIAGVGGRAIQIFFRREYERNDSQEMEKDYS